MKTRRRPVVERSWEDLDSIDFINKRCRTALLAIEAAGEIQLRDLCKELGWSPQMATEPIQRLKQNGFIEVEKDGRTRNLVFVTRHAVIN